MSMGEHVGNHAPHLLIAAVTASEAVTVALHGAQPAFALYGALIAGSSWVWHGHHDHDRGVWAGSMAQTMTWEPLVRPPTAPEPTALHAQMAKRMRETEKHVHAFAQKNNLRRISLALPFDDDVFSDARSIRHGDHGHLWLGPKWVHPRHTHHLPPVLEHELAHLRRRDTRTRLIVESAAVAATVLCAGLLPLPALAVSTLAAWLGTRANRWWSELACDAQSVRACGRGPVAAMWSADLAEEHTAPWPSRAWHAMCALRKHPPLRLRRWFALHAPLTLPATAHPLATSPLTAPTTTGTHGPSNGS
ncbi:hypothetical protein ACWF9B_00315 [Streptomyces sp. NPDC055089]